MPESQPNVCIPMKVEAFRLNAASADGPSRLAPISQPDFTRLRLDKSLRHDVLGDVDLQNTARGPEFSNRVTNLATGKLRRERFGMYLHWILPRFYRTGIAATESSADELKDLRSKHGHPEPDPSEGELDPHSPIYRSLPPRWIVLRHLTSKTPSNAGIPTFQAFVIESDRLSKIDDLDSHVDIEVDVSPSVYMKGENDSLAKQAEIYIGHKQHLDDWQEAGADSSIIRVPLSILGNINPVFSDYQPHNTNVFSILDNFSYKDNGSTKYLEKATANYYVLGWHPDHKEDPFSPPQQSPYPTHAERLKGCYMQLVETQSGKVADWLKAPFAADDPTKVLIHGALYQVEWDVQEKPPVVPADDVAKDYNDFSPVSVGVNPIDALLAVTHAHGLTRDVGKSRDSKPSPLAQDILSLQTMVIEQEEDPDTQLQAADMLFSSYFVPADGGRHWQVAGAATSDGLINTVPDPQERKDLSEVNRQQRAIDLSLREMQWMRWQIWAEWWKWVRTSEEHTDEEALVVQAKVDEFVSRHDRLVENVTGLSQKVNGTVEKYNWEMSTLPRFYTCRDPTVLLCGMKSGWPTDWSDLLKVRLDNHIVKMDDIFRTPPEGWPDLQNFATSVSAKLPAGLQETSRLLMKEFFVLQSFASDNPRLRQPPPTDIFFPLYHDLDSSETGEVWRDRWNNKQPWFPLFVEWEIEYYHIDHDSWIPASRGSYGPPKLCFEIKDDADISKTTNSRPISGRSLVLPHNNSMLKNTVEKLLKNKNSSENLDALKVDIDKLGLLTLTLSSISGQLATKQQNTHVKPTKHVPGYGPRPFQEAIDASRGAINKDAIQLMYDTTMTPYGDSPNFEDTTYSPFKPVVHGQFRFTKLNVIDKFGQAVSALNPDRGSKPNLHPYVSEFYSCTQDNSSGSSVPRTVITDSAQCAQLEPRINQESRLNGHYVLWSDVDHCWRPVTEYENPVWGWLVVNYVDNGLQVFLPDGTFYREIRLGGLNGTSVGIRAWLPFEPPPPESDEIPSKQIRALVERLRDPKYLQEFFDVMVGALDATMFTPNQYAGYLPAITGKPFALVNSGWSLQLSHPPDVNHSTSISPSAISESSIYSYNFQIKFGDKDRTFDGLLGYFGENSPMEFDLDKFYTYFARDGNPDSMTVIIEEDNYPMFQAFYNDPLKEISGKVSFKSPEEIDLDYNKGLKTFGMLVDPFTPIHAYAGFLPVTTLHLPGWAIEQGLKNITAFFHLGPMVMPNDVPSYDKERVLKSGSNLKDIPEPSPGTSKFSIPAIGVADWVWLQPYVGSPVSVDNIHFNPFQLTAVPNEPKYERTPYTAVEGYLYLKEPITSPSTTQHK